MIRHGLAVMLVTLGGSAVAQGTDFIACDGPLSDDDFYRLVACRAAPGQPCQEAFVRWRPQVAKALHIGFAPVAHGYPASLRDQVFHGLDLAIDAINGLGAGIHLVHDDDPAHQDITIFLVSSRHGEVIAGTGAPEIDGVAIDAAVVNITWDQDNFIDQAAIALASDLPVSNAYPVLLEEVTQALGLMTDIRNPHYETISVFSEDSNLVRKHGVQDRMAILRHYPRH